MKHLIKVIFVTTLLMSFLMVSAQDRNISGKVTDENGNVLTGATVVIKGTTKGTSTDIDGNFSLSIPENTVLVFSYIGYLTEEVTVSGQTDLQIGLLPELANINEVVVVGYGVQKKSLVTGSISKVKSDEITSTPALRIEQAIQGRTSGVVFNQASGNPGAQITVRIRGVASNSNSDPLYILNGFKTSKYVMNELDPADIESIEVLKDAASAAIYGSQGANGVIILTTKSGSGKKNATVVEYDAYYGFQKANPVEVMNAHQYREYFSEAYAYNKRRTSVTALDNPANSLNNLIGIYNSAEDSLTFKYNTPEYKYDFLKTKLDEALQSGAITQAQYTSTLNAINTRKALSFEEYKNNAYRKGSGFSPFVGNIDTLSNGTDWMNEIFQLAPMQKHHISLTTGSENSNLYLGASYFTQDGVVGGDKNNFTRYNLTVNADNQAKSWLKLGTHLTVAESKSRNLPVNDIYNNVVLSAMSFDPTAPKYWNTVSDIPVIFQPLADSLLQTPDGKYYSISSTTSGERVNPLAKMEVEQNNRTVTQRAFGDVFAELKILKSLTYRFSYSAELSLVTLDNWQPLFYYNVEYSNPHSYVSKEMQKYFNYQVDNIITYNKTLQNHSVTLMLGQSAGKNTGSSVRARRSDMYAENDNFNIIDNTPLTSDNLQLQQTGGFRNITTLVSYFGRLNYDFKEKYLFSTTIRRDGSSMFEKDHRFGTFPSVSAGWNIHKENFFDFPSISMLKLRASWGQNGSISNVTPYMWVSTTVVQNGGKWVVKNAAYNNELTWETSEQTDFGLDVGLFQNKLLLSADYYVKTTKDLLALPEVVAWTSRQSGLYQNVGNVSNKGFEVDLSYSDKFNKLGYDLKLTASYLTNKVTDFEAALLPGYVLFSGRQHTMFVEDKPAWYFQGYKVLGIFKNWEEIRNYTYTNPETGNINLIQPDAQPGDPKIQDNAGAYDSKGNPMPDGVISTADYTYLGKPLPTWTFGFSFNCNYKGFDLGVFLYSELDKTIFNALTRDDRTYYNRPERFYTERWTESNQTNDFIRSTYENTGGYAFGHNSLFFEDGSFLRLKNLQLGYTINNKLTQKVQISKLRIYLSANNLLTLTNYSGSDPEIGQTQGSNSYGVDMGFYPSAKQYLAGVTVTF